MITFFMLYLLVGVFTFGSIVTGSVLTGSKKDYQHLENVVKDKYPKERVKLVLVLAAAMASVIWPVVYFARLHDWLFSK